MKIGVKAAHLFGKGRLQLEAGGVLEVPVTRGAVVEVGKEVRWWQGVKPTITMLNPTGKPLSLYWLVRSGTTELERQGKLLKLAAGDRQLIEFEPPTEWRSSWKTVAQTQRDAQLVIRYEEKRSETNPNQIVDFQLVHEVPLWQKGALIFAALAAGILASLMIRSVIPKLQEAQSLRLAVKDLQSRTASVSEVVGGQLQAVLRHENGLIERMRDSMWFEPSFTTARLTAAIHQHRTRVELAEKLAEVRMRHRESQRDLVAWSLLEESETLLNEAVRVLQNPVLSDAEAALGRKLIQDAALRLGELPEASKAKTADELKARWKTAKGRWETDALKTKKESYKGEFPFQFAWLALADEAAFTQAVTTEAESRRLDSSLSLISLLAEIESLPVGTDPKRIAALQGIREQLKNPSYKCWLRAKQLLAQVKEDVFEDDLVEAIKAGRFSKVQEPEDVKSHTLVSLWILFDEARLNNAAAMDAVQCYWTFVGDGAYLTGWRTTAAAHVEDWWRYLPFLAKSPMKLELQISHAGNKVEAEDESKMEFELPVTAYPTALSRFWTLIQELGLLLVIPMLTLWWTHFQNATPGDFWALAAIGFTSDLVLGAITRRTAV